MSVKMLLHKVLPGWEKARDHKELHASDLTKEDNEFCSRELCLLDIYEKKKKDQFINTCLRTTFDNGNDYSRRIREEYLSDYAWGIWYCPRCHGQVGPCFRPETCPACSYLDLNYQEVFFKDEKSGVQGSVDLFVKLDKATSPLLRPVEIKTMDKDYFKKLVAPFSEHRVRTQLYLELIKRATNVSAEIVAKIDTSVATILYCSRGYGIADNSLVGIKDHAFSPFKEFEVKADPEAVETYFEKAQWVTDWRNNKMGTILPPRICESIGDNRANACPVKKECFSSLT